MYRLRLLSGTLLIATATLLSVFSTATAAQESIRKIWYGIYEAKDNKEIPDPKSPTGTRFETDRVSGPKTNSSDIVLRADVNFGFGFVANFEGPIQEVYFLPDQNGARGERPAFTRDNYVRRGEESYLGWFTAGAKREQHPPGVWTFQIRHNGRVLVEHSFNLTYE